MIIDNIIIKQLSLQIITILNIRLQDLIFCAEGIPQYHGMGSIVFAP